MGAEARRKEVAGELRRKIGGEAAAAVGELRELVERTQRDMRALAVGMAAIEKRIDATVAAPAAIRRDVLGLEEQLDAVRLRVDDCAQRSVTIELERHVQSRCMELAERVQFVARGIERVYGGLNGRIEVLENARAETKLQLTKLHQGLVDEFAACSRWRWLRRRTLAQTLVIVAALRENVE